jgi:uncharacterized protein DUF4082
MTVLNTANKVFLGAVAADKVYVGANKVWPPAVASAKNMLTSFTVGGARTDGPYVLGAFIHSVADQDIRKVGCWSFAPGITGATDVALVDQTNGAVLCRVTVTLTGPGGANKFVYADVPPPCKVLAGRRYALVVDGAPFLSAGQGWGSIASCASTVDFVVESACYGFGFGGNYNDAGTGINTEYFGVDLQYGGPTPFSDSCYQNIVPTSSSSGDYEVGLKCTITSSGRIHGVRYWHDINETNTSHVLKLWSGAGALLQQATSSGEPTASGWLQMLFASPQSVTAGQTYVVSRDVNSQYFAYLAGFHGSPIVRNNVTYPDAVYTTGHGSFPGASSGGSGYMVEPLYTLGST